MTQPEGVLVRLRLHTEPDSRLYAIAEALQFLAQAQRLSIARVLQSGGRTNQQISDATGLPFFQVASNIRSLRRFGMIVAKPGDQDTIYELAIPRLNEVISLIDTLHDPLNETIAC